MQITFVLIYHYYSSLVIIYHKLKRNVKFMPTGSPQIGSFFYINTVRVLRRPSETMGRVFIYQNLKGGGIFPAGQSSG